MKKILVLLMVVATICLALTSCRIKENSNDENTQNSSNSSPNASQTVHIVTGTDVFESEVTRLFNLLTSHFDNKTVTISDDPNAESYHAVIVGTSECKISKDANRLLTRMEKNDYGTSAYLIYTDGKSIAIAYEEDRYDSNAALSVAIDRLAADVLKEGYEKDLAQGIIVSGEVDPVVWQREIDEEKREEQWDRIAAQIGGELGENVVAAAKEYYLMYSPKIIQWMANLYDPETGAFYYSNAARNTQGYAPDIESTQQALGFFEDTGVLAGIGDSVYNLPDWMKESLGKWVKSLQDPNGYFYHPQWTKADVDASLSRRGRDLERALFLLGVSGLKPTYDTITGAKGDYTLNDGTRVDSDGNPIAVSALCVPLKTSVAAMVSKVVAVSDSKVTPHLRDEASFRKYLNSLDIRNDSYYVGNELSTQGAQIKNRDLQLKQQGADYSLVKILEEWLLTNQNPENGLWYFVEEYDKDYSIYDGVNGLLKISFLYNTLEIEFPNPMEAINSAIEGIYTDLEAKTVCYPYNTWFSVCNIFENLEKFSKNPAQTREQIAEIRRELLLDAPNSIIHTAEKVRTFLKPDGSFSYTPTASGATSQGLPVTVGGTNEGDVNASVICGYGTAYYMFKALGIEAPKQFGLSEWYLLIGILEDLGAVIKDENVANTEPVTFDEDDIGSAPTDLDIGQCKSSGQFMVIDDPRTEKSGKVFLFDSKVGAGDSVSLPCSGSYYASCAVFEGDFCIASGDNAYVAQIMLGQCYMLGIQINGDTVSIFDSSSQNSIKVTKDYGMTVKRGEWFKLRIEYYPSDHENVRIKVFINDKVAVVTDNYYDHLGVKVDTGYGTPQGNCAQVQIIGFSYRSVEMMMDNLRCYKQNTAYVPEHDLNNQPLYYNIDEPLSPEYTYDFEDCEAEGALPEDLILNGCDGYINDKDGDNELFLWGDFSLEVPFRKIIKKSNCYISQFTVNKNSIASNASMLFSVKDKENPSNTVYNITFIATSESTFALYSSANELLCEIPLADGEKALSFEYYPTEKVILIYADGKLVATTTRIETGAEKLEIGKMILDNLGTGTLNIILDDIKFENAVKEFEKEIEPEIERETHDFESESSATLVGGQISSNSTNKYAVLTDSSNLTIPINARSNARGAVIFGFDLLIKKISTQNGTVKIAFRDENENELLSFGINRLGLHEQTELSAYPAIAELSNGIFIPIRFEYHASTGETLIYVNDVFVAASSLVFRDGVDVSTATTVTVSASGNAEIYVDNSYFECYSKPYLPYNKSFNTDASDEGVLDFEGSTNNRLPNAIGLSDKTDYPTIVESVVKGKATKVLSLKNKYGIYDAISFAMTASSETDYNATVFETKMKIDYDAYDTTSHEIYLMNGSTPAYMMLVYRNASGDICIRDYSSNNSAFAGRIVGSLKSLTIREDEWFDLRMEYIYGDRDEVKIKTYINDTLVYESDNFYGKSSANTTAQPGNAVTGVSISSYSKTVATLMFDDLSIKDVKIDMSENNPGSNEKEPIRNLENGIIPDEMQFEKGNANSSGNYAGGEIITDSGKNGSKVFRFNMNSNKYSSLTIGSTASVSGANAYVFEADIHSVFGECSAPIYYIYLRNGSTTIYCLEIKAKPESGILVLKDLSSDIGSESVNGAEIYVANDWMNLRIEYYPSSEANLSRFKMYIDNSLVYVSDNYFTRGASSLGSMTSAFIQCYSTSVVDLRLDNIGLYSANLEYKDDSLGAKNNFENSSVESVTNNYVLNSTVYGNLSASNGTIYKVSEESGNKYLSLGFSGNSAEKLYLPSTSVKKSYNAFAVAMSIRLSDMETSEFCISTAAGDNVADSFTVKVQDGKVILYNSNNEVVLGSANEWIDLRIEIFKGVGRKTARIYSNNTLVASFTSGLSSVNYGDLNKATLYVSNGSFGKIDIDNIFVGKADKTS